MIKSIPLEKLLTIILVVFALKILLGYPIIDRFMILSGNYEDSIYQLNSHLLSTGSQILEYLVNFILGLWLFKASKSNNKQPLIWFILAIFFGLSAVLLFYVHSMYEEIKTKK